MVIDNKYGTWIGTTFGVKQGDTLLPFFSLYINELTFTLNHSGLGVEFGNERLCILLYADDIAFLDLQIKTSSHC